ncbi:30S ribosomal protein S12 methylthiotransferase RimO [Endomicrobium proavitum]|uniref:Ribosomal protein uS12 methylthiotransferase RimO n=1 Tax=Endomicrobium proavitum TaxID=1408281 RepID=A0A0G3WKH8_9BACT|nr:30S ribosomal protein S12 methylthiotransferase RimO [Endomicrobium proavitum]AKL97954.1 Ribosomal protein S12 methylthiotransferase RimO [Endomicrobium proavitum]
MLKVAVIVLGCPKNTVEAEYLLGILQSKNFAVCADTNDADVIVIHTCSFIDAARRESEKSISDALKIKRKKNVKVFVSGCLPQLLKEDFIKCFPEIDGFVGTGSLNKLPLLLQNKNAGDVLLEAGGLNDSKFRLLSSTLPCAYLKIAEGCNHKCSFCIIPNLRGKYKSRSLSSLKSEVQALAASGVKELSLIAQDTTSYGIDIYGKFSLNKLLAEISKTDKLKWIRLMYAYPVSVTDALLQEINSRENICKYIDIPIQHASEKILNSMNRPLATLKVIEKIKNKYPDIILRTSVITGFPGETDKDVQALTDFLQKGYFRYAGVFEYSNQKTAASSKLKKHIDGKTSSLRRVLVENAQYEVFKKDMKSLTGSQTEILVESCVKKGNNYTVTGRAPFQAPDIDGNVICESLKPVKSGSFCSVKIKTIKGYSIQAELL